MQVILLLPAWSHLAGAPLSTQSARLLGRGERLPETAPGRQAQLRRYFELPEGQWPLAALTRQDDCADAAGGLWLRADPCHIRPDLNGARLLAVGDGLVRDASAKALLPALQAVFVGAGFQFDMPAPGRWYLKLPDGAALPDTLPPDDALGLDLAEHVLQGQSARRWRALLSEIEITLHHHPHNAERQAAGQWPINSLWLWGGGVLPAKIPTPAAAFYSQDETALALAAAAGVAKLFKPLSHLEAVAKRFRKVFPAVPLSHLWERVPRRGGRGYGPSQKKQQLASAAQPRPLPNPSPINGRGAQQCTFATASLWERGWEEGTTGGGNPQSPTSIFDLTHLRSMRAFESDWLQPLLTALKRGQITQLHLDSETGPHWQLRRAHRWRIWRKPWSLPE